MKRELILSDLNVDDLEALKIEEDGSLDEVYVEKSKKLSTEQRNSLKDSDFALIQQVKNKTNGKMEDVRRFPINDTNHIANFFARINLAKNITAEEKALAEKRALAKAKELGMTDLLKKHNSQMGTPRTDEERAQNHFKISSEDWAKLAKEKQAEYISKLPKRGSGLAKSILRKAAKKLMDNKKVISTKDNEISLSKSKLEKFTKGIKTLANKIREGKISTQAKDLEISNLKVELEKSKLVKEEPIKSAIEEPKLETASLKVGDVRADGDASSQRIKKIREQSSAYLNPAH
jgi:hypothetical protein